MQPESSIAKTSSFIPSPLKSLWGGLKNNLTKIGWGAAIIAGVIAYLGIRHWIDTSAKSDTKRINELLQERDKAELEREKLRLEAAEAASKLEAEEARSRRLAEDRAEWEQEASTRAREILESEKRLEKLQRELESQVVDVIAEPGVLVEVDLNAINTQYNCFINAANAGEAATTCYGE
jgi:predicted nuclease with TOPRIM domain